MSHPSNTDWPPGFAVQPSPKSVPANLIEAFSSLPSSAVADCMGRTAGSVGLRAYHRPHSLSFAGPAVTVRVRPGDNLMIHLAIAQARPGDVIAVDGGSCLSQALVGGLMRTSALSRGVAAFVIDGAVRDLDEWEDGRLPVYAMGHSPRGPSKDGPGEINVPIACAGMAVVPGDLIVGDSDGVVTVPREDVGDVLARTHRHLEVERQIREQNQNGEQDLERFYRILRSKGCPIEKSV